MSYINRAKKEKFVILKIEAEIIMPIDDDVGEEIIATWARGASVQSFLIDAVTVITGKTKMLGNGKFNKEKKEK